MRERLDAAGGLQRRDQAATSGDRGLRRMNVPRHPVAQTIRDFLFGLVLFAGLSLAVVFDQGSNLGERFASGLTPSALAGDLTVSSLSAQTHADAAAAVKTALPMTLSTGDAVLTRTSPQLAMVLLAAVFSALVAFNFAFFRHLKRRFSWRQRVFD